MPGTRDIRHHASSSLALVAVVVIGALWAAGLASAASRSIHVKVTKKVITISGSRSSAKQVVQISYDPKKCASYSTEARRSVQFSDLRATKSGAYSYMILRSALHLAKPKPHYACVYLLDVHGSSVKSVAAARTKLT
jgi:hypothetical protein